MLTCVLSSTANNLIDVQKGSPGVSDHTDMSRITFGFSYVNVHAFPEVYNKRFLVLASSLMLFDLRQDVRLFHLLEKFYQFSYMSCMLKDQKSLPGLY